MSSHQLPFRLTQATQLVLRELLKEPASELYSLQVSEATGLPSGTLHPIFMRLLQHEIVEAVWEDPNETQPGRPRRRYYRLTTNGAERVRLALAEAHATSTPARRLRPSPAGGLS